MKIIYWLSIGSFFSLVLSIGVIIYLCKEGECYGIKNISFGDASVAVLGSIVGLLVGWQIYNALELNKKVKELERMYTFIQKEMYDKIDSLKTSVNKKADNSISEIRKESSIYRKKTELKISSYFMASLAASGIYNSPKLKIMFLNSSLRSSKQIKDKSLTLAVLGIWKDVILKSKEMKVSKKEKDVWLGCLEGIDTKEAIELRTIINSLKES